MLYFLAFEVPPSQVKTSHVIENYKEGILEWRDGLIADIISSLNPTGHTERTNALWT
jgi:hypothetical protein